MLRGVPFRRYFEPFAGGAALFFALRPENAVLSDTNAELVNFYNVVRDDPELLVKALRRYRNSRDDYYRIRDSVPRKHHTKAARLYYLMRLSFNGIYRENHNGVFNVPYGKKDYLSVLELDQIYSASAALQNAITIACRDFRRAVADAREGDLVYCDPPYTVRHNNNGFIKYNSKLFAWKDQTQLALVANELAQRGCYVVISNADHQDVSVLYKDFHQLVLRRPSVISANVVGRRMTTERLIFSPNIRMID
jgi:DNA adenine methylase